MVKVSVVKNLLQHTFVGVFAFPINILKDLIGIFFLGKTVNLGIEIVQEESGHIISMDKNFCFKPIVFIEAFLICIGHQDKVSDFIRKAQGHTSGVDTFKHLLGVIFLLQKNTGTNQLLNALVNVFDIHTGIQLCLNQRTEQLVVSPNTAVLFYGIVFVFHQQTQLIIVALNGF